MPSSSVSNFCPDTGGRRWSLGFASSVQSCCGEGGALQADIAVCGEHSPCSGHTGFALHRGVCAFPVYTAQAPGCSIWSGPCAECHSSFPVLHKNPDLVAPACCAFPGLSGSGSQELDGRTLPGCSAPSPLRGPSLSVSACACGVPAACVCSQELASSRDPHGGRCRPSRISRSLWIETGGLFAVWEGMPFRGPSLLLSPPPASYLRRGWACPWQASSSLEFLSPFVLRTAGSVFRLVNFSLALPQFKKSSLRLLSGPSGRSSP